MSRLQPDIDGKAATNAATNAAAVRMLMNSGVANLRVAIIPQGRNVMKVLMGNGKRRDGNRHGRKAAPVGGTVMTDGQAVHGTKVLVEVGMLLPRLGIRQLQVLVTTPVAAVGARAKAVAAAEATVVAKPTKARHGQMKMLREQCRHRHHAPTLLVQWKKPQKKHLLLLVGLQQSLLLPSSSGSGEIMAGAREEEGPGPGALATSNRASSEWK